jgi:peptide/nickel transport system ATP-binding protein
VNDIVLDIQNLAIALPPGGDRAYAVQDVNLQLRAGEVTCLIGESGSGKSLVARSILGLLPQPNVRISGGSIRFEGYDLAAASVPRMRAIRGARIAMIFQEPMTALNPLHTIGRQINEVLRIHTDLRRSARKARVIELLDSVHLPESDRLVRSFPHQLSGGQRQRAMIAMALALNPSLLIADEPTTALDVTTQAQILHLIRELQREHGTAVLFITHDFGVVADIADTVAVLQNGVLVETGTADDVLTAPTHPYTQALIAAVPKLVPPVPTAPNTAPFVCHVVSKSASRK